MGKTRRAKVVPQSRKRGTAVAETKPRVFKGWTVCEKLLRKSFKEIRTGSSQLIHVLGCSALMHGFEAEVNWFTGGNSYVTLPTAVAERRPGVYWAKAKFTRTKELSEDDEGPQTATASITHLRWLGARNEFMKMARLPNTIKDLGKKKHECLMEMLNFNCESSEVEEVE